MTSERVKRFLVMAGAWTTWGNILTLMIHHRMTVSDFVAALEIGILIAASKPLIDRMLLGRKLARKGLRESGTPLTPAGLGD